jgi:hypothetical protein
MVYNTQNYWGFGLYPSSGFNNFFLFFFLVIIKSGRWIKSETPVTKFHILSVLAYAPYSRMDKVDDTQWSNELLFNKYWMQLIKTFHVSSVLLCHPTFQVTVLPDHLAQNHNWVSKRICPTLHLYYTQQSNFCFWLDSNCSFRMGNCGMISAVISSLFSHTVLLHVTESTPYKQVLYTMTYLGFVLAVPAMFIRVPAVSAAYTNDTKSTSRFCQKRIKSTSYCHSKITFPSFSFLHSSKKRPQFKWIILIL